jgi:hypothetical protein
MKLPKTLRAALVPFAASLVLSACASSGARDSYGSGVPRGEAIAATTVLHHPELYDGKTVVLEGTVAEVCPIKGCWMTMTEGDRSMRVTFKDYGFFVPKDCAGRTARVHGLVAVRDVPVDEARHYLEDAGRHDEAAKITAPVRQLTMVADGVVLQPAE